ncbi:Cytochrome P450 4F1 [Leucoagaricus sp. SymC.cos]|nr:Cytochrome P450 4F1 [Leucoagaricus sp. SymC.cos]
MPLFLAVFLALSALTSWILYEIFVASKFSPLQKIAGPPSKGFTGNLSRILDPVCSAKAHEIYVKKYGRSIRIRGIVPWDERLLTLDPLSVQHVLKNSTIYEKPWQSRTLITSLIGCGMLSAEGNIHKRQRRVATPAFSIQNLRELVPLVFDKGNQLKDKWVGIISNGPQTCGGSSARLDVCHWISRATFDVIGIAGFDYHFNAIQDESNELFLAYKEMFEVAISQGSPWRTMLTIYLPWFNTIFPDQRQRIVKRCQSTIRRVAGKLIQEKKRKIEEAANYGKIYGGKDLLSLLLKSNASNDLAPENRISDEDILHNINTFMFAGSDTSSLSLTWTLYLLAQNPDMQTRLRNELLPIAPTTPISDLTEEEIQSLHNSLSNLPYLHNVTRESLRLIPPVHSSIRVATQDDEVPTMYPVYGRNGAIIEGKRSVTVPKGSFIHVAVEGFNLDKEMWGEDAWEFNPDRWDVLPEEAQELPGLFSNTLTFSAGPRVRLYFLPSFYDSGLTVMQSCIGMRFSMIEIKTFLYILLTHFAFTPTEEKINRVNVVLTRPFVSKRYKEGSQLPLIVRRLDSETNQSKVSPSA